MLNPVRQLTEKGRWAALGGVGDGVSALRQRYQPALRDGVARVLARVGATAPARFARGALTSVTFHRVLPEEQLRHYPIAGLAVTPEQLELILRQLGAHFDCMPLASAYRVWKQGKPLERPPLAVTFDDGALDNYEHARPVLERLGLKASFYIPVGNIDERRAPWHDRLGFALVRTVAAVRKRPDIDFDRLIGPFGVTVAAFAAVLPDEALRLAAHGVATAKRLPAEKRAACLVALEAALGGDQVPDWAGLMTWEQIRELGQAGNEIGSHSMTHPILPDCTNEQLREEIATSRLRLQHATGSSVPSFCYPNGSFDARCVAAVRAAGYECAVTTQWGLNRQGALPYELKRCDMDFARLQSRHGDFSEQRLFLRLSGLQPGLRRAR